MTLTSGANPAERRLGQRRLRATPHVEDGLARRGPHRYSTMSRSAPNRGILHTMCAMHKMSRINGNGTRARKKYSYKRLKLAQRLGQLGIFLTEEWRQGPRLGSP